MSLIKDAKDPEDVSIQRIPAIKLLISRKNQPQITRRVFPSRFFPSREKSGEFLPVLTPEEIIYFFFTRALTADKG